MTKDLGVNLVGHRLKLLDAFAALGAGAAKDAAERRQVTVMFSDLVGSTALFCVSVFRLGGVRGSHMPFSDHLANFAFLPQ